MLPKHRQVVKDVLAEFGVKIATELKETQWADYIARLQEEMPEAAEAAVEIRRYIGEIEAGKKVTDKPSIVVLRTIIAYPAPTKQNSGKAHGSALGDEEIAATKKPTGMETSR